MNKFNFKVFILEFEKSTSLDFFSLVDDLWEENWIKGNSKNNKNYLKDWIKFAYFLWKEKKITNISKIEGIWLSYHYFDVNYLKFFINYLLNSLLSIESLFIEYFNPWGLDKDKHKHFLETFIDNVDKLLRLAVIKHNMYELHNLTPYVFYVDYTHIKSKFVPYWLSLENKQKKIAFYLKWVFLLFLVSIFMLFFASTWNLSIHVWSFRVNFFVFLFFILFLLFLILFFALLNWYYNVSKLKDLYEYFSLMLDLSELELVWINKEDNQVELKKVIMSNITNLISSVDDIYNKSLVKFWIKTKY